MVWITERDGKSAGWCERSGDWCVDACDAADLLNINKHTGLKAL